MNLKSLLEDKYVLYVVVFFTFTTFIGYLLVEDTEAIVFMTIIGYLATYFSKNMIIILLIALLTTNFLVAVRVLNNNNSVEAFGGGNNRRPRKTPPAPSTASKAGPQPADEAVEAIEATGSKPRVDQDATVEEAYSNISKLLNTDAVNAMTSDTSDLFSKQSKLIGALEKMEPLMTRAGALMDKFDIEKMSDMAQKFGGMSEKFGGLGKK